MAFEFVPLGNLLRDKGYIRGPFGSALKRGEMKESGTPVYEQQHAIDGTRTFRFFVDVDKLEELKRFAVKTHDLIISCSGTVGRVSVIRPGDPLGIISQALLILRPDLDALSPTFLYYVLLSPQGQAELLKASHGAVQQNIAPRGVVEQIPIPLPSLKTQDDISAILTNLDDRITLLRDTNATLEAIAQALFKSWFVDFDPVRAKMEGRAPEGMDEATAALFPDSFEESELGLVPRGWRVGTLDDCCSRIESGGTPKRTTPEYWDGDISWLTSGEVRNPIVFDTKEKITALGVKESSAKLWPNGTTVVAMYGATAGEVCLLAQPTTANQACCGLIPRVDFRAFLFFCVRRERESLASKSSGSAQQKLNKGLVSGHQVIIPSEATVAAYEGVVGALLNSWIENERQAQTLATLRDTLLPRLISGQLRLPQAQAAAEEALA